MYYCGRDFPSFFYGVNGIWRCTDISKDLLINDEIRAKEVRVIDSDGTQLGVMPYSQAMDIAIKKNLDLVQIAPQAKPPACKIMDYGKYKFELAKREKENRKNQKTVTIKEVRFSPSIDTHDFETKVNQAAKFLKSGDKVKVTVRFRGREMQHTSIGRDLLTKFAEQVSEIGSVEKGAKLEDRFMAMFISPKTQDKK